MATDVKEGQQYVVDGAIFRCQYGSAPCQITAISNQKVKAQGKAIVTDNDVTFKLPTAPFVTCTQNTQVPPTCVYANGIWNTKTTVQQGNQNAIVEKSVMKCPVFGGEIKCIYTGQVQSVSAPELAEFKIETLSNFPLALEVSYSIPQEKPEEKASGVNSISYSKSIFRVGEEITIHAFSDSNHANELVAPKHVNWVVATTKEGEKTEGTGKKAKTVKAKYIDSLMTFKQVCPPFKIILNEPGKYIIEGGSDGILEGSKKIVGYNKIDIQKPLEGKNKIPMDKKCAVELEIVSGNSITGIKQTGNKETISDTVYVKQGGKTVFTPEFKMDYNAEFELLKCYVTKQNGESVIADDYKFDEGGHSLALTPSSAEVDYKITFSLYKKTNEFVEETPMSEKSILVHSYSEAVLYAYVPGGSSKDLVGNVTLRRPGDTLIFTVKQNKGNSYDLDKIVWSVKKDGTLLEPYDIKGEMILYNFKQEGIYTIIADLKNTSLSNGGVKGAVLTDFDEELIDSKDENVTILDGTQKNLVNEEGEGKHVNTINGGNHKERIITHKLEISRNKVTKVSLGSTNGFRYVGVRYPIDLSFLFGDATFYGEKMDVKLSCDSADADCQNGMFIANKPGSYIIKATLNDTVCKSQPIKIQASEFSKWEFCDSEKKKISYIGRNMKFGINASVPAWGKIVDDGKPNKPIKVAVFCKNKALCSFKTELDKTGSFHVGNIDVEKDIIENAKNIVSFDGHQDLMITFVVYDYPSKQVNKLSFSKVGHGLFSTHVNLTVKSKPFIDGYFADKNGGKLVDMMTYDDDVYVNLRILNYKKEDLEKLMLRVYENKFGWDPVVYEADKIILDKDGKANIKVEIKDTTIEFDDASLNSLKFSDDAKLDNLKFTEKKVSEESSLPRLFYFMVVESDDYGIIKKSKLAYIDEFNKRFVYPSSPGDSYNYNSKDLLDLLKCNPEPQKINTARNYYYQLKLISKKDGNNYVKSYNSLAPVVVGEDWKKEEKEEDFQRCHCYRDFSEDFVRKMILKLRGKEENSNLDNVWEGTSETKDLDDKSVSRLTRELNVCFRKYGISKCIQKIAFLANVCVETTIFKDLDELPSGFESSKSKYKGRGLLHLTGEDNYKKYKDKTKVDVVSKPKLLSTNIHYAVDSACRAFSEIIKMPEWRQDSTIKWKDSNNKSLNDTALLIESEKGENASKDSLDYFRLLCQKLNGVDVAKDQNPNGWENRKKYYNKLKEIFDYNVKVCDKTEFVYFPEEWHDPLDNMMSCYFTQYGNPKPYNSIFCTRSGSNHQGVDLFAKIKTPVYACMDGEVLAINENSSTGGKVIYLRVTGRRQLAVLNLRKRNYKRIFVKGQYEDDANDIEYRERENETDFNPKNGITFVYMHLDEIHVRKGDFVTAGQQIGLSGRTGENAKNSQGPHLHFEICSKEYTIRANPAYYLYFKQYRITNDFKIVIYNCDSCTDRTKCDKCKGDKISNPKVSKEDYSKISYSDSGLEEQRKTRLEMRDLNKKLGLSNSL